MSHFLLLLLLVKALPAQGCQKCGDSCDGEFPEEWWKPGYCQADLTCGRYQPECKPCVCAELYAPVCGDDGNTYSNACRAKCSEAKIAHDGPCACLCGEPCKKVAHYGTTDRETYDGICQEDNKTCEVGATRPHCVCFPQPRHPQNCPMVRCLQKPGCKLILDTMKVPWVRDSNYRCCPKQCHFDCDPPDHVIARRKECSYPSGCHNCDCKQCSMSGGCAWHIAKNGNKPFCSNKCRIEKGCMPSSVARNLCLKEGKCLCAEVDYSATPWVPVCANNGKTYRNKCAAECAGVQRYVPGQCSCQCAETNTPVCGSNGRTYHNSCALHCWAGVKVVNEGACPCQFNMCERCQLSSGERVPSGWAGPDNEWNYCNTCWCADGKLTCTRHVCPPDGRVFVQVISPDEHILPSDFLQTELEEDQLQEPIEPAVHGANNTSNTQILMVASTFVFVAASL